jgi:hypothetical protein
MQDFANTLSQNLGSIFGRVRPCAELERISEALAASWPAQALFLGEVHEDRRDWRPLMWIAT